MNATPLPLDTRTCQQRQDAAIADLRARVAALELRTSDSALDHGALVAHLLTRVAALEARPLPQLDAAITWLGNPPPAIRFALLEPVRDDALDDDADPFENA